MLKRIIIYSVSLIVSIILHWIIIYRLLNYIFLEDYTVLFVFILAYILYFLTLVSLKEVKKIEIDISFCIYLLVVFIAIFLKGYSISDVILNPLSFLNTIEVTEIQSILNIMLLIPLGVYKKHYNIPILFIIIGFVLTECFQYLFNVGTFDLGDITLYFVGYIIGVLSYKIYRRY